MTPMNPYVTAVAPLSDYIFEVAFENGEVRFFDLKPFLDRGVFTRLRENETWCSARGVAGSIEWDGGLDLSYFSCAKFSLKNGREA